MLEKEMAEIKVKLVAITAGRPARVPSWQDTKIGRWPSDGMLREVEDKRAPEWWKRDARGSRDLSEVDKLLANAGLGRLTRYDTRFLQAKARCAEKRK